MRYPLAALALVAGSVLTADAPQTRAACWYFSAKDFVLSPAP